VWLGGSYTGLVVDTLWRGGSYAVVWWWLHCGLVVVKV
jgi:hypothetical protein